MTAATMLKRHALLSSLGLGLFAQEMLRVQGQPGLNVLLCAIAGVAVLVWLSREREHAASPEFWMLIAGALVFAAFIALRNAEALLAMNVLVAAALVVLAAGEGGAAWLRSAGITAVVESTVRVGLVVAAGPLSWRGVPGGLWSPRATRRPAVVAVQGLALGIPLLLVFGGLLTSADPVFARMVDETLHVNLEPLLGRLLPAGVLAWLSAGFLRALLVRRASAVF